MTAHSDDNWFPPALAELTRCDRPQDHATSPLIPALSSDRRSIIGFTVADYLLQRLIHERRSQRLSAVTWAAFSDSIQERDDLMRLADNAQKRLLFSIALPLYLRLANAGDETATSTLDQILAVQGDVEQLQTRANDGDHYAATQLPYAFAALGDVEQLKSRPLAEEDDNARLLADALASIFRLSVALA